MHKEGFKARTEVLDYYVDQDFGFKHYKEKLEDFRTKVKYDIITCMLVLELVDDRKKIFETIINLANEKTLIFVSFPNINSIEQKLWRREIIKSDAKLKDLFLEKQTLFDLDTFKMECKLFNLEIKEIKKMINLPIYSTNPKLRINRKIYEDLDKNLEGFLEPSNIVCFLKKFN